MAAGRRLSELLQEQQEPFLVEAAKIRRPRRGRGGAGSEGGAGGACCPVAACQRLLRLCNHGFKKRSGGGGIGGLRSALSKVLCGKALRSAFRWENLGGGCFTGVGVGGDREFRRLRRSAGHSGECDARAMEFDDEYEREGAARWKTDMEVDSSRQLSPVSVLELHSDEDSPVHPRWEEDEKPSTSGSSPSILSSDFHGPTSPCFTYNVHGGKALAMETTEEEDEEAAGNRGGKCIEEQISSWERIAGDIYKIPGMVELDLSEHTQQWRRGLEPEVREIGARIETLIFEEIRRETVCDMLASHCTLFSPPSR
ncbi:hypothetical protein CFC21_056173 [Triticum aestivum]|uniref:DUF4378 domain-containing protein n=2 Tax=Triticum aestivum TaxID=4565 RepID=A0A3B6IJD0_WHEAT|nr:uncharacterized protein LOC123094240 [Triticum aestivum]KAF7047226.1 hypothetical protein CFC21_056173 [Triticum aestivum]